MNTGIGTGRSLSDLAPASLPHRIPTPDGTVERRFRAVNRERLTRLTAALQPRQRIFIELLPLLFHSNHPRLPGFVSAETPFGVAGYLPTRTTIAAARGLAEDPDYKRRIPREYAIEAIYLIGSAGTIAYTDKSDFDIWLCHRQGLTPQALDQLRQKAELVSLWADSLGLEVHFFPLSAEEVRLGHQSPLSGESSGTAQRHLLVDEFYRTALLVAGREPLWWLVPPEHEGDYGDYVQELLERGVVRASDVIDFGGLSCIPSNEFFGAALWQLYKAVESPYKSLLKILLLEAYASEFPHTELVSQRYKRMIYAGTTQLDSLDPYVIMLEKVEQYLERIGDQERLELARRGLYIKTGERLTRARTHNAEDERYHQLLRLTQRWGWDRSHLHTLDLRKSWKIDRILDERRLLVNGLTRSYRFLSAFAREREDVAAITQDDMNVLGRRLFAAYEHKAGKVERLTQGITQDLSEQHLTFRQVVSDEQTSWVLYRGAPSPDKSWSAQPALKRARNLFDLLVWCHVNRVATVTTGLSVASMDEKLVSEREVALIMETLRQQLPVYELTEPSLEDLSAPARPTRAGIFINLGVDPFATYTRQGKFLTTDRHDPLNYSSREENLALSFDYLFVTNWQEIFAFRFEGLDGLMECLCQHLNLCAQRPLPLSTTCLSANRGEPIARRISTLFQEASACFASAPDPDMTRFVTKVGGSHFVVNGTHGSKCYERVGADGDLLRRLAQPGPRFRSTEFERHLAPKSPLPAIFQTNRPGVIQLFLHASQGTAQVYVLDELGALHYDSMSFHNEDVLLSQYARFFDAVRFRENAAPATPGDGTPTLATEFYRLIRHGDRGIGVHAVETRGETAKTGYMELKVISQRTRDRTEFTLFCDGVEFSTVEHGEQVFEAAALHVLALRRDQGQYPIYITDMDLSGTAVAGDAAAPRQTIHYLSYKKRIETLLNQALGRT